MSLIVDGTTGVTFNDSSLQGAAASPYVLKNRIINGAMVIDQRNAGASVTNISGTVFAVDRFSIYGTQASKFTGQQNAGSVTPPAGFTNYLGITSSSAYSITSTDTFLIRHKIEGYNMSDFAWGTANAKTVTLSFWVRSSLTGTFGGSLTNSAQDRCYPYSYTISAANTWEYKTITISGDTSGTWLTTNGTGIDSFFSLGTGSTFSGTAGAWTSTPNLYSATGTTSVVGTNGATFYITGVQLEIGTSATPFERRLYGQELINCQRYYWQQLYTETYETILDPARAGGTSSAYGTFYFPVTMRAAPSVANNGVGNFRVNDSRGNDQTCNSITVSYVTPSKATLVFGKATANFTVADCVYVNTEFTNDAALYFNAEL